MKNPYINPLNQNKDLFLFQDLQNPRLTWRLYSQLGGKRLAGPILTGFYVNNSQFSITHGYSSGLGDTIGTAINARMRNAVRDIARRSRDVYNNRELIESIKDKAADLVLGNISDLIEFFGGDENNIAAKAREAVMKFDIAKALESQLRRSQVNTQGSMSKLYDSTTVGIPDISNLSCIIWTTPNSKCEDAIRNLYSKYFLGKFKFVAKDGGGYWMAPNGLDIAGDNPLKDKDVKGAFTLRAGPYIFKNLLLNSVRWEFSKEFAAFPMSDGELPKATNSPAYARLTIDLNKYKFITGSYLNSTYIPVDNKTTKINEEKYKSLYNQNQS